MSNSNNFKLQINLTKAYKTDDGRAFVEGIASGPEVDLTGERMSPEAIKSMADSLYKHIIELRDAHRDEWNDDLGEVLELSVTPDNQLFYKAELDLRLSKAQDLWYRMTEKGKKFGVSIGGRVIRAGMEWVAEMGREVYTYFDVELFEISITRQAAYQHSFAAVVTKSMKGTPMSQDVTKNDAEEVVEEVVEVEAPVEEVEAEAEVQEEIAAEEVQEEEAEVVIEEEVEDVAAEEPSDATIQDESEADEAEVEKSEEAATEEVDAEAEVETEEVEAPAEEAEAEAEAEGEVAKALGEVETLRKSMSQLTEELQTLTKSLSDKTAELEEVKAELDEKSGELETATEALEEANTELETLKSRKVAAFEGFEVEKSQEAPSWVQDVLSIRKAS